jgi:CheY-like chemotaxis protein
VTIAGGGLEGVKQALAADPPFAALLMDLQMPDIDGFEATRRLLAAPQFNGAPIIAMTANVFASDIEQCLAAGMADHIKKPIDLDDLINTLLRHCQVTDGPAVTDAAPLAQPSTPPTPLPSNSSNSSSLDSSAAIRRLGGDSALHAKLLLAFCNGALAQVTTLENCIEAQQWQAAVRHLHTLKGNAGTVGAIALANLADEGEKRCKEHLDAATHSPFTRHGEELLLAGLRAQIATLLAATKPPALIGAATEPPVPSGAALDRAALSSSLSELASLLGQHNMRATRLLDQLKAHYGQALGAQLEPLTEALEQLDMDLALQRCNVLNQSISAQPADND